MKQAIQKAISSGDWMIETPNVEKFVDKEQWLLRETDGLKQVILTSAEITSDPLFWQALGKAMGWRTTYNGRKEWVNKKWLKEWHRFIDHLAEGRDEESFFKDLL